MLPGDWLLLALLVAAGFALAGRRPGRRAARSQPPPPDADDPAAALLRDRGYAVVAAAAEAEVALRVDGRGQPRRVRADYLVERGGRIYAVRLRGGSRGARVGDAAGRRLLLEFALAFRPDGVLLVDPRRGRIRTVEFSAAGGPARLARHPLALPAAFAAGFLLALALARWPRLLP